MPERMEQPTDPTELDMGAAVEAEEMAVNELVVVIAKDLATDELTVETETGSVPAATLDEALDIAREALAGTPPGEVRDEVAAEVYPEPEMMR